MDQLRFVSVGNTTSHTNIGDIFTWYILYSLVVEWEHHILKEEYSGMLLMGYFQNVFWSCN